LSNFWFVCNIRVAGNVYRKGECQVCSLKFQVSGRKEHVPSPVTSNSKPQTPCPPPPWARQTCKTNPIEPGRRANTQNKPTGTECRAGLPRSGTPCRGNPRSSRGQALRRGETCKTNPILPRRRRVAEEIMQNEPNFTPPQAADGGNCAKRSQTWADWGMWVKVVVWGAARPGSETCKTNPIWGPEAPRLRIGDCGLQRRRQGQQMAVSVQDTASLGVEWCKTNPIWRRQGRAPEAKCAKRTQFGPACSVPVRALGSIGTLRAAGPRAGWVCCEETPDGVTTNGVRVQNEPNFA
jgi:hypothetical protein